jgi:hypothetical protein
MKRYTAKVAVETDYEFYAKFGNQNDAIDYIGDLFSYSSSIYEAEVNTSLQVSWYRLWTNGANSDPWTATSGTSSALDEFRIYWNTNMGSVQRTISHMISGKSLGGGIGYLGVLCDNSYGYGLSANIEGDFNINSPTMVWDVTVISHEIGHNFDSPHTHDYCNIGGNAEPVDRCYSSSCSNGDGYPCNPNFSGCGTIMSYCHHLD